MSRPPPPDEFSGLALRELHDQAYGGWVIGETTLISQSVIDLAGEEATNGIRGHTGMSPDALLPSIREASGKFLQEYKYKGDHNAMKGYSVAGSTIILPVPPRRPCSRILRELALNTGIVALIIAKNASHDLGQAHSHPLQQLAHTGRVRP